jgi:drug/metabolite transporter (DMT)-like permease
MCGVLALALAFSSSVAWGLADFLGGLKARKLPLLNVLVGSQLAGLILIAAFVALRGEGPPGGDFAAFAALSGLAGVFGLSAFYRGLAVGNMAIVAPISATAAIVPLAIGVATGDRPSGFEWTGLALALTGVALASREEVTGTAATPRVARGAGLAVLSALGFGLFFATIDRASDGDIAWAILVNRVTGVALLLAASLVVRPAVAATRADVRALAIIGGLDITANALFAAASTKGLISLVAVLGSMYPLTTIALAATVLGERPHRLAQVGVAAALAGVVLIAAG